MVDRQEVEALLAKAQSVAPADAVFGEERIGVEGSTLAALCRSWLAVQEAPVGYALMGRGDWIEVFNMAADDRHAVEGQRVRIVKEVGE